MYIIEAQSGANSFRNCVIGQGETEQAAWDDALGPKPWSEYTKKLKKSYWCRKLEAGEEIPSAYND